jgi:rhomboid protease GluP
VQFSGFGAIRTAFNKCISEGGKRNTDDWIYVGINLLWGLTGGIDNAAHIGGLLSGALIGIILYKLDDGRKTI